LVEVGQYAGLAPSSTVRGMPQIEDVIARTNKAFGHFLRARTRFNLQASIKLSDLVTKEPAKEVES